MSLALRHFNSIITEVSETCYNVEVIELESHLGMTMQVAKNICELYLSLGQAFFLLAY